MKLLRSTFLAWSIATSSSSSAWAFTPQTNLQTRRRELNHYSNNILSPISSTSPASSSSALHVSGFSASSNTARARKSFGFDSVPTELTPEDEEWARSLERVEEEVVVVKEYLWELAGELVKEAKERDAKLNPAVEEEAAVTSSAEDVELLGGGGYGSYGTGIDEKTIGQLGLGLKPHLRPVERLGDAVVLSGIFENGSSGGGGAGGGGFDSTLLNLLNNGSLMEDSPENFKFGRIDLLVKDGEGDGVSSAKKRIISREARYSGLMDKLQILPSSAPATSTLPSVEQLSTASTWILHLQASEVKDLLPQVGALAKESGSIRNVAILVSGCEGEETMESFSEEWASLLQMGAEAGFGSTLVATGELYDSPTDDAKYYHVSQLFEPQDEPTSGTGEPSQDTADITTELQAKSAFPTSTPPKLTRKEAYRTLAHALSLQSTVNSAYFSHEHSPATMALCAQPKLYDKERFDDLGLQAKDMLTLETPWWVLEGRLLRGMRECGFSRGLEVEVMMTRGVKAFRKTLLPPPESSLLSLDLTPPPPTIDPKLAARNAFLQRYYDALPTPFVTLKHPEDDTEKDPNQDLHEVFQIAKDWARREFYTRTINEEMEGYSKNLKEFMVQVWPEAVQAGIDKYEEMEDKGIERRKKKDIFTQEYEIAVKWREEEEEKEGKGKDDKMDALTQRTFERVKRQYFDELGLGMGYEDEYSDEEEEEGEVKLLEDVANKE